MTSVIIIRVWWRNWFPRKTFAHKYLSMVSIVVVIVLILQIASATRKYVRSSNVFTCTDHNYGYRINKNEGSSFEKREILITFFENRHCFKVGFSSWSDCEAFLSGITYYLPYVYAKLSNLFLVENDEF